MKSKIDKGQITSQQGNPGVITINNPDWNMTGDYTCFVQTFKSTDKRNAKLNIIGMKSEIEPFNDNLYSKLFLSIFLFSNIMQFLKVTSP